MSVELTFYPKTATREQLKQHLLEFGFYKNPDTSSTFAIEFSWYKTEDFLSFVGVEADIVEFDDPKAPCQFGVHTRTRAGASFADRDCQNRLMRSARKKFGGDFFNDWDGKNRYIKLEPDPRDAAARGIYIAYERTLSDVGAVKFALPNPTEGMEKMVGTELEYVSTMDPVRVLYNALVPFAVAALEHFFGQTFRILLRYDAAAQTKLNEQSKKIEMSDVIAIRDGYKTIEDVVADWYSFQNIDSIHKAFNDWFDIDVWKLLRRRKKIGNRLPMLEEKLNSLIQFRHGVVHRFELDRTLRKDGINEILELVLAIIEEFTIGVEVKRGIPIRDQID